MPNVELTVACYAMNFTTGKVAIDESETFEFDPEDTDNLVANIVANSDYAMGKVDSLHDQGYEIVAMHPSEPCIVLCNHTETLEGDHIHMVMYSEEPENQLVFLTFLNREMMKSRAETN